MRRFCCALVVSLVVLLGAPPPSAAEGVYSPPVDAPVVDPFRPPVSDFGPGNRGIDYATGRGDEVRAAAGGEVVFAGLVAGSRHVVVLHPDGLRTSYSFLAGVLVERGDTVERGDMLGATAQRLHFGVRAGERYLDPAELLAGAAPRVHLVPVRESSDEEGNALLRALGGAASAVVRATEAGVDWARGEVAAAWELARSEVESAMVALEVARHYLSMPYETFRLAWRARRYLQSQNGCTPADVPAPSRPAGRRIALLVGGLGSAAGEASILDVDTRSLGYADGDVAQFSYRGGQAPGSRSLAEITTTTYDAADSQGDLAVAAARFRELLHEVRRRHPGVPVDVLAHSQGGVVVRAALGEATDGIDVRLPRVEHVITLGSPHHGTDAATANAGLGTTTAGTAAQGGVHIASGGDLNPTSVAAGQLAETSDFIEALGRRPLPAGARVTTVAARGDLTVPAAQSALGDATNVLVPLDGAGAHASLPGSAEAHREVALALAGRGPTCRDMRLDVVRSLGISVAEDLVGAGALAGSWWLEGRSRGADVPSKGPDR